MFSGFEGTVREMSRSARVARSSLLSLVLLVSATASAQEPSDGLTSLPMTRYREAHAAMERSDWQEARAVLLELWQRSKSYDVAASLGEVEHALGNDVSAARYLTFAVAHLAPKERPETLTRYRAALRELEAQVGRVQVNVSEEAAEIRIDGNLVGLSPLSSTVFVTPGEHTIEARGQGSTASNRIEVSRGSFAVVELALAKPAPAPTSVALAAPTPKANPETSAEPARSRSSLPLWLGGGATLVGTGVAVGFGLAANSAKNKAHALEARLGPDGCSSGMATRSACEAAERAVDAQRRNAMLSWVGVGVASAGAIATVGYLLFWPKPKPTRSTSLRATAELTRTGGGLAFTGEF